MAGLALDGLQLNRIYIGENRINNVRFNNQDVVAVPMMLGATTVGGVTSIPTLSGLGTTLRAGDILLLVGSSSSTQLPIATGFTSIETSANVVRYTIQYKVMSANPIGSITGLGAQGSYVVMALRNVDINSMIFSSVNGNAESEFDEESGNTVTYFFNPITPSIEDLSKNSSYLIVSGAFIENESWSSTTVSPPTGHTLVAISDNGNSTSTTVTSVRLFDGDSPRLVQGGTFAVSSSIYRNYNVGFTLGFRTKAGVISLGEEVVPEPFITQTLQGRTVSADIEQFDSVGASASIQLKFGVDGTYSGVVVNSGGTLVNVQEFTDGIWFDSSA